MNGIRSDWLEIWKELEFIRLSNNWENKVYEELVKRLQSKQIPIRQITLSANPDTPSWLYERFK